MDYDRLRELQEKFNENPRRYFAPLANEYRKGGQAKRAIEICREQLAHMPGHMSGQIVYGQALYETGEFEEARKVFLRALTVDPENLIALRTLGDMSLQGGNMSEARTWYAKLLDADPKDTAAIALISEIDASADAAPVAVAAEIPGVDPDAGDQQIPATIEEVPSLLPSAAENSAPFGLERHYPERETAADAALPETGLATEGLASKRPDDSGALGGVSSARAEELPPLATAQPEESRSISTPQADEPVPLSTPQADEPVPLSTAQADAPPPVSSVQQAEASEEAEEKTFTGASAEPFVNETMAQLYLQQGYKQLALKVYRQLAEARPGDHALRDRIREIEAADAAEHPSEVPVAPSPWRQPESEEDSSFDRPSAPPSRHRESVESPVREEPRAEPERSAGRQPSIREFFATLGRRRPPRASSNPGSRSNNKPPENSPSLGAAPSGPSLDTVFAGATVSPSDARAAARLAGAFSGGTGASRTPPTPPMPTPRVNPRVPQTQESEEDVAKFRAWLDGLTGE